MTKFQGFSRFPFGLTSERLTASVMLRVLKIVAAGAFIILGDLSVGLCNPRPTPTPVPTPSQSQSLSKYAKGRKLRQNPNEAKPTVVITDDNLETMAAGVELTAVTQRTAPTSKAAPTTDLVENDPKRYWRSRFQNQVDEIQRLEKMADDLSREIVGLWDLFYRCDEPDRRDWEIKPRLEKMIDEKGKIVENLGLARSGLDDLVVNARKTGVLPGWYRDLLK